MKKESFFCTAECTLHVIGGRWKLAILRELWSGKPKRFGELLRTVSGISGEVLSQQLRALESQRVIVRFSIDSRILHTEYQLTALGKTLEPVVRSMHRWGARHRRILLRSKLQARRPLPPPAQRQSKGTKIGAMAQVDNWNLL